jgi:hypothetical protein
MSDETLELLSAFRGGISEPDDATTKRVYQGAITAGARRTGGSSRAHSLSRRIRSRRRLWVAVAFAALVLVPTAVAVRGQIVDFFQGTPAPPAISASLEMNNKRADLPTRDGFALRFPHADVSKAHGVIQIETAEGPEDLWAAPNDEGGQCYFIDFANDKPGPGGQYGFGGCDTPEGINASKINFGDVWVLPHPSVKTAYGRVYVDAARVELMLDDGSTRSLPVVEGFFLASLAKTDTVTRVTAYDAGGNEVATFSTAPATDGNGHQHEKTRTDTVTQP